MKHAFTLIELIIIVILIGILAVSVSPVFRRDTLIPATNQVLDHIRYTQQLALNQDMFVPSADFSSYPKSFPNDYQRKKDAQQWFKKWWRIQFHDNNSYSVYSDHPSNSESNYYDLKPDRYDRVARDPLSGLYIVGDLGSTTAYYDNERLKLVDLEVEYDVNVTISGCGTSRQIVFDNLGRPHCSQPYGDGDLRHPYDKMRSGYIDVALKTENRETHICITPVTGYTYISANTSCP